MLLKLFTNFTASSFAPPCNSPFKVPIPETIALVKSDLVDAVTLAAKVDALNPCSAYKINISSSASIFSLFALLGSIELATK